MGGAYSKGGLKFFLVVDHFTFEIGLLVSYFLMMIFH